MDKMIVDPNAIGELREFKIICTYHTQETAKYKVVARSESDALEISRRQFYKDHTTFCTLDKVERRNS